VENVEAFIDSLFTVERNYISGDCYKVQPEATQIQVKDESRNLDIIALTSKKKVTVYHFATHRVPAVEQLASVIRSEKEAGRVQEP
jgi:hypothetical protein